MIATTTSEEPVEISHAHTASIPVPDLSPQRLDINGSEVERSVVRTRKFGVQEETSPEESTFLQKRSSTPKVADRLTTWPVPGVLRAENEEDITALWSPIRSMTSP
jgi:hypothetical protein